MDLNPNNEQTPTEPTINNQPASQAVGPIAPSIAPEPFIPPEIIPPAPAPVEPIQTFVSNPAPTTVNPETTPEASFNPIPVSSTPETVQSPFFQPVAQTPMQAETPVPVVAPKEKNLMKLWIALGIALVLFGALIAGYFVSKGNADSVADTYTSSLKSYLGQVYDKTSSATASPSDVKSSLSELSKPQLKSAFLGFLSSKYTDAQTTVKTSNSKLDTLNAQVADYVAVNDYHTAYAHLLTETGSVGTGIQALNNTLSLIKQAKASADKTNAPDELKANFTDLSKDYAEMITDLTTMISAFNSGDRASFTTSYSAFAAANSKSVTAEKPIDTYYNDLSSKFISSANDIKTYSDSIK